MLDTYEFTVEEFTNPTERITAENNFREIDPNYRNPNEDLEASSSKRKES